MIASLQLFPLSLFIVPPVISSDGAETHSLVVGSSLTQFCNATGLPAPSITWYRSGLLFPCINTFPLKFPPFLRVEERKGKERRREKMRLSLSVCLSLSRTHTHTHTHIRLSLFNFLLSVSYHLSEFLSLYFTILSIYHYLFLSLSHHLSVCFFLFFSHTIQILLN